MSVAKTKTATTSVKLLSCKEIVEQQENRRQARVGPQPWIIRKLTVGIVILVFAWATYVYIGRVCVRMIRKDDNVVGSRGLGIALLVIFAPLWLMFVWTYLKVILTPPGFARDHIPQTPRPGLPTFDDPLPRRPQPAHITTSYPYSQRNPPYSPNRRTRKPSDWSISDDDGWMPSGLGSPSAYAMASGSLKDVRSVSSHDKERDSGIGHQRSASSPDSVAAARSRNGQAPEIAEVEEVQEGKESRDGTVRDKPRISTSSRRLTRSPPPQRSAPTTQSGSPISPVSSRGDSRPATAGGSQPHPHHPTQSITSAMSTQTGTTLIHPSSTAHLDTDVTDRDDEGTAERDKPGSPVPSQGSRKLRKSTASRPKSPTSPAQDNKEESLADFLASAPPDSASYPPRSPTTPRPFSQQPQQQPSFERVRGRHVRPTGVGNGPSDDESDDLPPPLHSRRPPTAPVLDEDFRYCSRDGFVKPYRTHHCRTCGTCVLYYDHHCPWIGQCVGARNRKFFVNFLIWCVAFTIWVFASLLPIVIITGQRTTAGGGLIDGQVIGVMGAAILFLLFSASLLITHIHLLMYNASTVEWYGFQRMRERERALLGEMFPPCIGGPCGGHGGDPFKGYRETGEKAKEEGWCAAFCCRPNGHAYRDKKRTRMQWDAEWGRIGKEGNLWWVDSSTDEDRGTIGSKRRQWEQVMGRSWVEWLLPIGDTSAKGLDYRPNPRFDASGRWRRRREWPPELQ